MSHFSTASESSTGRAAPGAGLELSIIIPAYNEEARIAPTLQAIAAFLHSSRIPAEVLVVDDGSNDGTARCVEDMAKSVPLLRLIHNPGNRGKGYSIRHGFAESRGRRVLLTDADLSTPIEEIHKLLPFLVDKGFGGAIGSRAVDSSTVEVPQGWLRRTMGKTFNLLVRMLTGLPFRDTQCGFKLLDREAFLPIFRVARVDRFSYDVEILMLAVRRGIGIAEIPVIWRNSPQSKVNFASDSLQMLGDILRMAIRERTGGYRESP
ncbi:MAG: glycosyltransferase family 2 protein [Acidobacteria bacterium]|nr:glycosyltransferase family 2 protein [Acidobacteriota bacterium]MCI0568148.1 glycosyltransferase family 2 protein [Acidobacteriota bacterium]